MRYVLRTRQAMLVAVGAAYVFVLAWFNRQPIPTATLVHETDFALMLRDTNTDHLGAQNRDAHWIEPVRFLPNVDPNAKSGSTAEANAENIRHPPGTVDIDAGLLYIRLHTEYITMRPEEPLGGLLKVYRKSLRFVASSSNSNSNSRQDEENEGAWELLFADRLPGPIKNYHLDRTRLRNEDGSYAPRKLALLYFMPKNESVVYRTRIYDIESLHEAEFFSSSNKIVGPQWWDQRARAAKDPEIALQTIKAAAMYGLCPNDSIKFADTVYSSSQFSRCVGPSGLMMKSVDFAIPGSLEVMEFSLRGSTLLYSRLNDIVRFRVLELPAAPDGSLLASGAADKSIAQTAGPEVSEYQRNVGSQSFLAQLESTRPGSGIDVFLAQGATVSDTFYFSFFLLQNKTSGLLWADENVKRYRLTVHQQFSGLSRDELRLVNDPPLVDQVGLTSVFYFKATDVIVAVDTEWFRDYGSPNVTQLQRVRESRPPYISTLNSPVAVNMTLDESGTLLAMSTINDELFVFSRARASSSKRLFDYRHYFRSPWARPWKATEPVSSIDVLSEGETDSFNWQLKLTWQPSTLMSVVYWEGSINSPDSPFADTKRFIARAQHQSSTTCLRFLNFDPMQLSHASQADHHHNAATAAATAVGTRSGIVRIAALSAAGRLRMWELDSHRRNPHILWPFVTEHWGLMFMLAAVVSCCVYNERRWE
ncbi:hypothetical protein J3B02_002983 [Coemansia erecta]|uniref:Uncharacterized protein n=1 Tax=Coemansia asiatica TaxID=1052880 RepID=A0A9W7XL09_9FUNG|nr:hypothetical protein LPJ64_003805 [Coemansia asiatica]KAJ2853770.1 hypothetical protein J3B02_002983 [Coemansia erecta]KAJ2880840.1 hypothetical protein FB639_002745 [Coemansia asiatica]